MEPKRVAIVTGGGRGIGEAAALRLARDGIRLSLWARSAGEIESVAARIRLGGGEAVAIPTDIADWESVHSAVEKTESAFGHVDILVNNAGIGGPRAPVAEADPQRWAQTITVDLTGQFYCMRAVLPRMIERRRGKIVNVTGGGAGEPYPTNSAYASAKTGLVRLSETVAQEVAQFNIQVNTMTPGFVVTRLTEEALHEYQATDPEQAARYRQIMVARSFPPEAGAELIACLVSSASDEITGRWLTVHDKWQDLVGDPRRLMDEDLYVLRRHPR